MTVFLLAGDACGCGCCYGMPIRAYETEAAARAALAAPGLFDPSSAGGFGFGTVSLLRVTEAGAEQIACRDVWERE